MSCRSQPEMMGVPLRALNLDRRSEKVRSLYPVRSSANGPSRPGLSEEPPPGVLTDPPLNTATRVVLLGIDGGTFSLLEPWMNDGTLPNFAKVRAEGAIGALASTVPPTTPTAWTTCFTGVNPGKHGIYDFREIPPAPPGTATHHARFRQVAPSLAQAQQGREENRHPEHTHHLSARAARRMHDLGHADARARG